MSDGSLGCQITQLATFAHSSCVWRSLNVSHVLAIVVRSLRDTNTRADRNVWMQNLCFRLHNMEKAAEYDESVYAFASSYTHEELESMPNDISKVSKSAS